VAVDDEHVDAVLHSSNRFFAWPTTVQRQEQ
jgi:hypothetical protein